MDKVKRRNPSEEVQVKLFSRWVRQKVFTSRGIEVSDVVENLKDGLLLIQLMEVLTETTLTKKYNKNPKMKPHIIDNINIALDFCWASGVEMKLKPSAEDVFDGNKRAVLGLIWAIMLKFMKIEEEEEEGGAMSPRDAILMWAQQKTAGYPNVVLENMTSSWDNGLALCAIIHKHRPKLIGDFAALNPENAKENVALAMKAAYTYFGLEEFITVDDFFTLDEKCMVVYISEYFYGIMAARKIDLAVKSIGKVIKFTEENDQLKAQFTEKFDTFKELLEKVKAVLNDRTIDNTLAGAEKKIEEFYVYKREQKNELISGQLSLETIYNQLATRLAQNNRPKWGPNVVSEIHNEMDLLEKTEQERKIALHNELNRQRKLRNLHKQHGARANKLKVWGETKTANLETKEECDSVSMALLNLRILDACEVEITSVESNQGEPLFKIGAGLADEQFELQDEVNAAETEIKELFAKLRDLAKAKKPILEDDLQRETFKEKLLLKVKQHSGQDAALKNWISDRREFLTKEETVDSVSDAQSHLTILEAFEPDRQVMMSTSLSTIVKLGEEIIAAQYKTEYSEYVYEKPDEITAIHTALNTAFDELAELAKQKEARLAAQLQLEKEKEELRLQFSETVASLQRLERDIADNTESTSFGFVLQEVRDFEPLMAQEDADYTAAATTLLDSAKSTEAAMQAKGITENRYTTATVADLAAVLDRINASLAARQESYKTVLAKMEADDAMCKDFATQAESFSHDLNTSKDTVSASEAEPEAQLAAVKALVDSKDSAFGSRLPAIADLSQKIEAAGIASNPHTSLSSKDCEVLFAQYGDFLQRKIKMIEEEIEAVRLCGITPEQFKEIEDTFAHFDADASGFIDGKELKNCLFSLGEEATKARVQELMKTHGSAQGIDMEGFKNIMIPIIGITANKEDILAAFFTICKEEKTIEAPALELVMPEHDYQYFTTNAPRENAKFNYNSWTEDVFSR